MPFHIQRGNSRIYRSPVISQPTKSIDYDHRTVQSYPAFFLIEFPSALHCCRRLVLDSSALHKASVAIQRDGLGAKRIRNNICPVYIITLYPSGAPRYCDCKEKEQHTILQLICHLHP